MEKRTYTIICKKCHHQMKYMPMNFSAEKFIKKCVYCGFNNTVKIRKW
ncbi:hypothetical protein J4232_03155 [Candidatus Woesearchaeota archaeon]|nr:hypothetical protein [Candidatus Woesearchaeota archaeon]